jgi:hypothetical protein
MSETNRIVAVASLTNRTVLNRRSERPAFRDTDQSIGVGLGPLICI